MILASFGNDTRKERQLEDGEGSTVKSSQEQDNNFDGRSAENFVC